jgi:ribonuclease PH
VLRGWPLQDQLGAVSVGVVEGVPMCDLCYTEDSGAETDMNLVKTGKGGYVEVQGSAEGAPFSGELLEGMLALGGTAIERILELQKAALGGG